MISQARNLEDLLERARKATPLKVAVVHPVTQLVFSAVRHAQQQGLLAPVLVGPRERVAQAARESGLDLDPRDIVDAEHSHDAATKACELVSQGRVQALMKGSLHTDELLHAVLANPKVRGELRLSHCYVLEHPRYPKPFILTDCAINIAPDLKVKAEIVRNAVELFRALCTEERPLVAALAAVETVTPDMTATVDAAALAKMAERGQLGDCVLDGPLAFDNAFSREAAKEKGIQSAVAGLADIFLVPNLDAGNMLAKELIFLGQARAAGVVMGARVPIILTSRADSDDTRLLSCAVARLTAPRETGS